MTAFLYSSLIYPLMLFFFWILSFVDAKIKRGFAVRKQPWPELGSSLNLPVYWFHVASGELEYAKPVMRELKKSRQCIILVTYFSPSVEGSLKKTPEVDFFLPSPWDTPFAWKKFLQKYHPQVLAIARTDLWPQMIWQASKARVPIILFSATLPSHSPRVASFWGRLFYSLLTEHITYISCVTDEDKRNFLRICQTSTVSSDGDTRYDQVFYRLQNSTPRLDLKKYFTSPEKVFIAGSTWPQDEEVLIPAFTALIHHGYKIILAPHEVDRNHLQKISSHLMLHKIKFSNLSSLGSSDFDLLLVDQVGHLASLYPLASVAFIGGSFKKSVHSVMEAAAAGCYTLVGPKHYNNREALLLKSKGFLQEVHTTEEIKNFFFKRNIVSPTMNNQISDFMKSQTGVSKKIAQQILDLKRQV